jgi:hypothetical protein
MTTRPQVSDLVLSSSPPFFYSYGIPSGTLTAVLPFLGAFVRYAARGVISTRRTAVRVDTLSVCLIYVLDPSAERAWRRQVRVQSRVKCRRHEGAFACLNASER